MSRLLSVIIPVYNAGEYLKPLVSSIQNQTWKNIEIILVNDGSKDNSGSICDILAQEDERIKVIHKENEGQSSARNKGLEIAKGDIIAFADHDDLLHPEMYEKMIGELGNKDVQVCACKFANVLQEDIRNIRFKKCSETIKSIILEEKELIHDYFTPTWRIPIWNKIYCREIINDMKFSDHHLGEDNIFSFEIIKKCKKVALIDEIFYFQRMHGDNFEFTGISYFVELLEAKEKILQDIKKVYTKEYRNAQKLFLYEGIRLFNAYLDSGINKYSQQAKEIMKIIKRNCNNLVIADLPIGHKILFLRLKYRKKIELKKIII